MMVLVKDNVAFKSRLNIARHILGPTGCKPKRIIFYKGV